MSNLSLRAAVLADNGFIRQVFAAALPLYERLMPGSFEANLRNMDILTEKGLDFNATGLDGWIIAERLAAQEEARGFAGIGPLNPQQAYMAALYLLPGSQRQGVGGTALTQLEAIYAKRGFAEMLLLVHAQAGWATDFYTGKGYQLLTAVQTEMVAYGGEKLGYLYEPGLLLMAKPLIPDKAEQVGEQLV